MVPQEKKQRLTGTQVEDAIKSSLYGYEHAKSLETLVRGGRGDEVLWAMVEECSKASSGRVLREVFIPLRTHFALLGVESALTVLARFLDVIEEAAYLRNVLILFVEFISNVQVMAFDKLREELKKQLPVLIRFLYKADLLCECVYVSRALGRLLIAESTYISSSIEQNVLWHTLVMKHKGLKKCTVMLVLTLLMEAATDDKQYDRHEMSRGLEEDVDGYQDDPVLSLRHQLADLLTLQLGAIVTRCPEEETSALVRFLLTFWIQQGQLENFFDECAKECQVGSVREVLLPVLLNEIQPLLDEKIEEENKRAVLHEMFKRKLGLAANEIVKSSSLPAHLIVEELLKCDSLLESVRLLVLLSERSVGSRSVAVDEHLSGEFALKLLTSPRPDLSSHVLTLRAAACLLELCRGGKQEKSLTSLCLAVASTAPPGSNAELMQAQGELLLAALFYCPSAVTRDETALFVELTANYFRAIQEADGLSAIESGRLAYLAAKLVDLIAVHEAPFSRVIALIVSECLEKPAGAIELALLKLCKTNDKYGTALLASNLPEDRKRALARFFPKVNAVKQRVV